MAESPAVEKTGTLYYGDNLDVLRRHVKDASVDLVYLDPPFNSNASYNVLFREADKTPAHSQIEAFGDTWKWDSAAAHDYQMVVENAGRVSDAMRAFRTFLGESDVLAYLSMMAPRLVELRRVLKPTGSIYLHCDPTASHYLKMLMDATFGPELFRNEIVWKRTSAHSSAKRYGPVHDTILFYGRSVEARWYGSVVAHDPDYVEGFFRQVEDGSGRRFHANVLTGPGVRKGESGQPWRGYEPTKHGRHWAIPGRMIEHLGLQGLSVQARLDALDAAGRVYWPKKAGGSPRVKYYADELAGQQAADVWTDIRPISGHSPERLGYPTQKPEALLDRIVKASSDPGGVVLDPFCGCGTAIASAQKLGRRWIGIDITPLAISFTKRRLRLGEVVSDDLRLNLF